jgi:hypothetical protein
MLRVVQLHDLRRDVRLKSLAIGRWVGTKRRGRCRLHRMHRADLRWCELLQNGVRDSAARERTSGTRRNVDVSIIVASGYLSLSKQWSPYHSKTQRKDACCIVDVLG